MHDVTVDGIAVFRDAKAMQDFSRAGFRYRGGKGLSYRHLINLMPPHRRYVETHLGGGAVMTHKLPADENIGIDLDGRVIARWERAGLPRSRFWQADAVQLLPDLGLCDADLVYCDPPYVASTRRTPRYYRHDYADSDHVKLLELLLRLPCRVVVSGYMSELYADMLASWSRTDYLALTHRGLVAECAWTNFTPTPVLHDYAFIGSTFREREQLRRRLQALARRISRTGDLELNAILADLAASRPDAILAAAERISS